MILLFYILRSPVVLAEAVLTSTHNMWFEQKYEKNIRIFLSENFPFMVVNFSIYLNRRIFVMGNISKFPV